MFPLIGNGDMYIELRNFNIKILGELLIDSNDFARILEKRLYSIRASAVSVAGILARLYPLYKDKSIE